MLNVFNSFDFIGFVLLFFIFIGFGHIFVTKKIWYETN